MHRQSMLVPSQSIADTLPNANFGFDELRDRMAKFSSKFDAFIEQGRKRVLEERNQFRMDMAELQGKEDGRNLVDSHPKRCGGREHTSLFLFTFKDQQDCLTRSQP